MRNRILKKHNLIFLFPLFSTILRAESSNDMNNVIDSCNIILANSTDSSSIPILNPVMKLVNHLLCITQNVTVNLLTTISTAIGLIMVSLLVLELMKSILANASRLEFMNIVGMVFSKSIGKILIILITITRINITKPNGIKITTTLYGWLINVFYTMFVKLGLLFWAKSNSDAILYSDGSINAGNLVLTLLYSPVTLLRNTLSTFAGVFTVLPLIFNIILTVLIIFKLIGIVVSYISATFEFLTLSAFSLFYLPFYMLEKTNQIGTKAVSVILNNGIKLMLNVAFIGVTLQIFNHLFSGGWSITGLIYAAIAVEILSKLENSVGEISNAIVNGGGLGTSSDSSFTGLVMAGAAITGSAVMSGASSLKSAIQSGMDSFNETNGTFGEKMASFLKNNTLSKSLDAKFNKFTGDLGNISTLFKDIKDGKGFKKATSKFKMNNAKTKKDYNESMSDVSKMNSKYAFSTETIEAMINTISMSASLTGNQELYRLSDSLANSLHKDYNKEGNYYNNMSKEYDTIYEKFKSIIEGNETKPNTDETTNSNRYNDNTKNNEETNNNNESMKENIVNNETSSHDSTTSNNENVDINVETNDTTNDNTENEI